MSASGAMNHPPAGRPCSRLRSYYANGCVCDAAEQQEQHGVQQQQQELPAATAVTVGAVPWWKLAMIPPR